MSIGNILMEMGLFDKAEEYYQQYLKSSKEEISSVYKQLAIINQVKGDHNLGQMHWKTAADMYVSVSPHLDNSKIDILHQLNDRIFDKSKSFDFDQLFSYLQTAFCNDLATFGHDHLCTAKNYEVLGILEQSQGLTSY
jgi:tetratricopeptide (TPR) repeat protein